MILNRLYELSERHALAADVAFEDQPVPFVIVIGEDGQYLGIQEQRGTITEPAKKKGAPPRTRPDNGHLRSIPRPHVPSTNRGAARYFVDTIPRVLPVAVDVEDAQKVAASRETFWRQIAEADTNDPAVAAVAKFGRLLVTDSELAARVCQEINDLKPGVSDRITFTWYPDNGQLIIQRAEVRRWYTALYQNVIGAKQDAGPLGLCQITKQHGPIPRSHPAKLKGIPGGLPTGVSVVSFDKAAFESYNLDGSANAGIGYAAADGYLRALDALIQNRIPGVVKSSLKISNLLMLYWTREPTDTQFVMSLDSSDPAEIRALLDAPRAAQSDKLTTNVNQFYLLGLTGNAARVIVRDYLELPLPRVRDNLRQWFRDLTIADATVDGIGQPTYRFPISQLAVSTAKDFDGIAPDTPARLLRAAFTGGPVPESLMVAALRRLRAEGSDGFKPARLALIKLVLTRQEIPVSETLDPEKRDPAYIYGQLLQVFEQIQAKALGKVNSTVVDKYYGTFSAAPALVFPRLYANARNHLRKLRSEKPPVCTNLERLLAALTDQLKPTHPLGLLSLQDQGLFAIGYYHMKARMFKEQAERKAKKALTTSSPTPGE